MRIVSSFSKLILLLFLSFSFSLPLHAETDDKVDATSLDEGAPALPDQISDTPYIRRSAVKGEYRVLVMGDSLGVGAWQGLYQNFKGEEEPAFDIVQKAAVNTGIVRSDRLNWPKEVRQLSKAERFQIAVLMFGANDMQSIRLKGKAHHYQTEGWVTHYNNRLDEIISSLKQADIAVYWMGLPIVKSKRRRGDYEYLNEIFKAKAEEHGVRFIDTWQLTADKKGNYAQAGRDLEGKQTRLRARDGIHFTAAGYRKFVSPVEEAIRHDIKALKAAVSEGGDNADPSQEKGS